MESLMLRETGQPSKILLVDDHPLVRIGLRQELEAEPSVQVVGEASNGREAILMAKALSPDLVFMDISMPGMCGLEATQAILRTIPSIRIIVMTIHDSWEYLSAAMRAGATGYLLKTALATELVSALKKVIRGEVYLSTQLDPRWRRQFVIRDAYPNTSPAELLTSRQREILKLIAEGQNTKSIASILRISDKTVEYHRARLMDQVSAWDIPGLVRYAVRIGLVAS